MMTRTLGQFALLCALGAWSLQACKSVESGAGIKENTNNRDDHSSRDSGYGPPKVNRMVWADGVEQALPPAKSKELPEIAHNMSGLWYLRGPSAGNGRVGLPAGVALLTLAGAKVNKIGNLMIDKDQALTYAWDPVPGLRDDMQSNEVKNFECELIFHDDKNGDVLWPAEGAFPGSETGWYKFTLVKDGDWLRTSLAEGKRLPDYHMLRIVDEDGRRTPAYETYLDDGFKGKMLTVIVPKDSALGRGEQIPPGGGRLVYDDEPERNSRDSSIEQPTDSTDKREGRSLKPDSHPGRH